MTDKEAPEDLGAPASYLTLADGTAVYDRSGGKAGDVEHVLADEKSDVFHGLLIKTANGHRFAQASLVDGIYQHGVIITAAATDLPEPSADPAAQHADDAPLGHSLKQAWDWLVQPH